MADTLGEQAHQAAIKSVQTDKPARFTVGGYLSRDGRVVGGITYDRKLTNLWGITAYAKAYWHDQPVRVHGPTIEGEAGFELTREFPTQKP